MPLNLAVTGHASNQQAYTNCAYVHPSDLTKLADAAGQAPEVVLEKGLICAVGEAVFTVRCVCCAGRRARGCRGGGGGAAAAAATAVGPARLPPRAIGVRCAAASAWVKPRPPCVANPPPAPPRTSSDRSPYDHYKPGTIGVGMMQRMAGNLPLDAAVPVTPFAPPKGQNFTMASVQLEVDLLKKGADATLDAPEVAAFLHKTFHNHVFKIGQTFAVAFQDGAVGLKATVRGFEYIDTGGKKADDPLAAKFGLFTRTTELQLKKAASAPPGLKITGSSSSKGSQLFAKGFNFEALGIGGLNAEFQDIFRRAFASRTIPPDLLRKMGQKHVRGMLLYGPPGCGKTLIARQIGKALHAHPPKIVNGPEILNKYVGQSEENIRNLFADAEKEQAESGDDSELHIIIFDEFDAIGASWCAAQAATAVGRGSSEVRGDGERAAHAQHTRPPLPSPPARVQPSSAAPVAAARASTTAS